MIKLGQRLVRETTAPYEYTDGVEQKTEEIRVRYYSLSIAETREVAAKLQTIFEAAKDKGEPAWFVQSLMFVVADLPDLAGTDGKPIKTEFDKNGNPTAKTVKSFESISLFNLEAIKRAIDEDQRPKEQPVKSPNG